MFRADVRARRLRITLTPLVDVVFILLLFFMLSSTFHRYRSIDLEPGSRENGSAVHFERIQLLVLADGRVQVDGTTVAFDDAELQTSLAEWRHQDRSVAVGAESSASVQTLVTALDTLRRAGVDSLQLFETVAP